MLPPSPFAAASPPPSPFEAAADSPGAAPGASPQRPSRRLPGEGRLLLYQHSFLRLRSSVARLAQRDAAARDAAAAAGALEAVEEGRSGEAASGGSGGEGAEPEQALEPAKGSPPMGSDLSGRSTAFEWQGKALRVTARFYPLLTPSGCAGGSRLALDPPLSPQQAANVYAGVWAGLLS